MPDMNPLIYVVFGNMYLAQKNPRASASHNKTVLVNIENGEIKDEAAYFLTVDIKLRTGKNILLEICNIVFYYLL